MPISSRVTLTAIQQERRRGSSSTGDGFEVPSSYYSINIFQVTKAEKKNPKIERKRNKSWYEELHQATLPAH